MNLKSYLKFAVKIKIVTPLRSLFSRLSRRRVNKDGWEGRTLLVNLQSLGDMVVFTSVLKHYKNRFPGKRIYLLMKSGLGLEKFFVPALVDEIITVNYRKLTVNPFYGAHLVERLRGIGFETVINHDFSAAEIFGKMLALEIGAKEAICYEGLGVEWREPFDFQQRKNLEIVRKKIFPKYNKVVPSIDPVRNREGSQRASVSNGVDMSVEPSERLFSAVRHYVAIYEEVAGRSENDYATYLPYGLGAKDIEKFGLRRDKYAVMNVSASVSYKRWSLFRFSKIAEFLAEKGLKTVVVGSGSDKLVAGEFCDIYFPQAINLAGKTSLEELVGVAGNSLLVFTNDTSLVHIAVALKKPMVCVTGGGQFGMFSNYGYPGINKWLWKKTQCYFDSWRCGRALEGGMPSPCLDAVSLSSTLNELRALLDYLKEGRETKENFSVGFTAQESTAKKDGKIKVVYAGIRNDNYNPRRSLSFEYNNFYTTLKQMPNIDVVEYPYDAIIGIGKKRWNDELLSLVKSEKPDLFFAFMFSDELDKKVLDEIKKITKSVAWFADDHWRIWNYSRHYAPHFTRAVTTWSRAPEIYMRHSIENIIRSQWGADPKTWHPIYGGSTSIDVSFIGQRTIARARVVEMLRATGIDVFVRGWGWPEGRASYDEMIDIFSRSKICLNVNDSPSRFSARSLGRLFFARRRGRLAPSFNVLDNFRTWLHKNVPQIKARPFELSSCGAFVISGYADDLGNYYEENEEMVFYRNAGELPEKIKYYLARDTERESIAKAGHLRTIKEHAYEQRFAEIFKLLNL